MTTLYKATMTGDILVAPGYDCIELDTGGADRNLDGIEGAGYADGAAVIVICNGSETLTLRDGQPVGDGNILFLPGGMNRVLTANDRPYCFRRNDGGARGDGWYGLTDGGPIASGSSQLQNGVQSLAIAGVTAESFFLIQPKGSLPLNTGSISYECSSGTVTIAGASALDTREFVWYWMS